MIAPKKITLTTHLMDLPANEPGSPPNSLSACLGAHGLYEIEGFVLRLSPLVHEKVDSATNKDLNEITNDELVAYSTYLHETVHWWQHIGTTHGLITSLCYPAQTHKTFDSLQLLGKYKEVSKPIKAWAEKAMLSGLDHTDERVRLANIATNYAIDLDYYRYITMKPMELNTVATSNYFESIGHSFTIAYETVLSLISSAVDPEYKFIPNPDDYYEELNNLRNRKATGFYFGSEIIVPPISGIDILEGQARFIQLQFLSFLSSEHLTIKDISQQGYLDGHYGKAFLTFESIVEKNAMHIGEPSIAIFLLICDLALNASEGFPFKFKNVENIIEDCDPNFRFLNLCYAAKENLSELQKTIINYTKEEYIRATEILTKGSGLENHYNALIKINHWHDTQASLQELASQYKTFKYPAENLTIRFVFSHYIAICLDKLKNPEFFCWTGVCKTRNSGLYQELWLKHLSTFADKAYEDGVFPREMPGRSPEDIQETFNTFYAVNLLFGLTKQWILEDGEFKHNYDWLADHRKTEKIKERTEKNFKALYNIGLSDIKIGNPARE